MTRSIRVFLVPLFALTCIAFDAVAQGDEGKESALDSLLKTELNVPSSQIQIRSGSRYLQQREDAPGSLSIVSAEDISLFGYATLLDALATIRGMYITDDRYLGNVGVRGFCRPGDYSNRILILVDGHPMNENYYGGAGIERQLGIDMRDVSHIEVLRGPSSAVYGTGAMLGVVNVVTKGGHALGGLRLSLDAGSYGEAALSMSYGTRFDNGAQLAVSGFYSRADGPDVYFPEYDDPSTNNGIAHALDWDRTAGARASVSFGDGRISGMVSRFETGIPTGAWDMIFNDSRAKYIENRAYVEATQRVGLGMGHELSLRAYADYVGFYGTYPYDLLQDDVGDCAWYTAESQYLWDVTASARFTAGLSFTRTPLAFYVLRDAAGVYNHVIAPYSLAAAHMQQEFRWSESFAVFLGVRRDEDLTQRLGRFSPRVVLVYNPAPSSALKFLYGEAFRAPNVSERANEDASTRWRINPNIRPEVIRTIDLTYEQKLGADFRFGASAFVFHMHNLIDYVEDASDTSRYYANIGSAFSYGIEAEMQARLTGGLLAYANTSLLRATQGDADDELTNSPSFLLRAGLAMPFPGVCTASAECAYESDRLTEYGTRSDNGVLVHLRVSSPPILGGVRASLSVRNLFDASYTHPATRDYRQYAIPQLGRTIHFSLSYGR